MSGIIAFIVRLVGYGLVVGIPARFAHYLWEQKGLDRIAELQPSHDLAVIIAVVATCFIAFIGYGRLRKPAIFASFYLAGAIVTAPFVFARLSPL